MVGKSTGRLLYFSYCFCPGAFDAVGALKRSLDGWVPWMKLVSHDRPVVGAIIWLPNSPNSQEIWSVHVLGPPKIIQVNATPWGWTPSGSNIWRTWILWSRGPSSGWGLFFVRQGEVATKTGGSCGKGLRDPLVAYMSKGFPFDVEGASGLTEPQQ